MANPHSGKVFLVGAGPGDPGLITIRGRDLVTRADVIVHDQLGAPSFLALARPEAELIDVGKRAARHTLPQTEINRLLVEKALEGKLVVRLKGGDPFIFGRGGEELEELHRNGIPFEVVPGVSSAIGGPAYAGIPLTHRSCTTALAIVTGHEADLKETSSIPWAGLAGINTVVFLMGVGQLPHIVSALHGAGKSLDTPVAIIENATMPRQRTLTGTMANIVDRAKSADIKPPAVIVFGRVAEFQERFSWFDKRPLHGRTIVVTRAATQAGGLSDQLRELGAEVLLFPTIKVQAIDPNPKFDTFLKHLPDYHSLVFTSVNGVEIFWDQLSRRGLDMRSLAGRRVVCIGPATAQALRDRGIIPDVIPETFVAESLLPSFSGLSPVRVAILRASEARDILPKTLTENGHQVDIIPLYHTVREGSDLSSVSNLLREGRIDGVTFTSASTVDGFVQALSKEDVDLKKIPAFVIGPVTAETCRSCDIHPLVEASEHTVPGLVYAMLEFFKSHANRN